MKKSITRGMSKKPDQSMGMRPLFREAASPRKRAESRLLAEIRLAIGARPDILAARINTGVYETPDGTGRRVRSAPTGYPDLPITQLRRVMERVEIETNFSKHEKNRWHVYGQSVFIETKRPRGGKLTQEQRDFQAAAERVGAIYIAPTTVDEVLDVLGPVPEWVR